MGKALDPHKKKRTVKRWASLLLAIAVSSCESACCRWVSVWQKLCTQDLYGSTISSFTGNHSVWLSSSGYRCISLDIHKLYYLMSFIGFGIGQASCIFERLLIEVIDLCHLGQARYILGCHSTIGIIGWTLSLLVIIRWTLSSFTDWRYWSLSSFNKRDLYLENIQRYWINKLIYLMILIDEHYHLDEQCSWISHLELTSHHSGQTLWWIKLLLDCYHSCFDIIWINWMTMLSHISWNRQYSHLIIYILKLLHVIEHWLDGAVFSPASVRAYIWWSISAI